MSQNYIFNEGDIVVSKNEYLASYETLKDTLGIVVNYNPENDYLVIGTLRPEKYAIPPTFSMRGEYYRIITDEERKIWNIA